MQTRLTAGRGRGGQADELVHTAAGLQAEVPDPVTLGFVEQVQDEGSARLDELGKFTVGGLHFRLNRSAYYVREFSILLKTLRIRNIPTWTSYEQFVRRGLGPAFHYLRSVGRRLRRVRAIGPRRRAAEPRRARRRSDDRR